MPSNSKGFSEGAIVGTIVGASVILISVLVVIAVVLTRRHRSKPWVRYSGLLVELKYSRRSRYIKGYMSLTDVYKNIIVESFSCRLEFWGYHGSLRHPFTTTIQSKFIGIIFFLSREITVFCKFNIVYWDLLQTLLQTTSSTSSGKPKWAKRWNSNVSD